MRSIYSSTRSAVDRTNRAFLHLIDNLERYYPDAAAAIEAVERARFQLHEAIDDFQCEREAADA